MYFFVFNIDKYNIKYHKTDWNKKKNALDLFKNLKLAFLEGMR